MDGSKAKSDALGESQRADDLRHQRSSDAPFEIIVPLTVRPDPEIYRRAAADGITGVIARPWRDDADPLDAKLAGITQFGNAFCSGTNRASAR